jgi:protein-disulfide isomerase
MIRVNDLARDPDGDPGAQPAAAPTPDVTPDAAPAAPGGAAQDDAAQKDAAQNGAAQNGAAPGGATPGDATPNDAAGGAADSPAAGSPPEGSVPDRPSDAPHESVRRENRLGTLGIGALIVVLAFGAGIAVGRATISGEDAASAPPVAEAPSASADSSGAPTPAASGIASLPSDGPRLGRADAKVVIDYWADYQCPFCAKFAQEIIPQLESRIADGTIALVHRDYAFLDWRAPGTESLDSAMAVRCAGREGRYWQMHDAVYAAQAGENQGGFARQRLAQLAASVGLDPAAFEACMNDRAAMVEVLEDTAAAVRSGVDSTPTVDVNGQRFPGVSDVPALLAAIDAAAAGASPAPLPTAEPITGPWSEVPTDGREAGDPDAPVTVELWMDYQAAASGPVADGLGPELRARIADGGVRVVQRDLATLGDESLLAAATVRCVARQGDPAWLVHDALAASAQGPDRGIYTATAILRYASRLGFDIAPLSDCLDDPAVLADIRAETATGTGHGLDTAPAVIIRKGDDEVARFSGELDVAKIIKAIDAAG